MKSTHTLLAALLAALLLVSSGCTESAAEKPKAKKKQGAHVRVLNATDGPLSFILYPQQLNEQNQPGESNPFQKVVPGSKKLQILSIDKKLLQEVDVTLGSGMPTTFVVRGGPKTFIVSRIDNEERFGSKEQSTVMLSSGYEGSPVGVTLKGPAGDLPLGQASKIGVGPVSQAQPGTYEVLVNGKSIAKRALEAGVAYSVMLRTFKGAPAATILRNSPPEMKVVGVESGASAG